MKAGAITLTAESAGLIQLNGNLDSTANFNAGNIYLNGPVSVGPGSHSLTTDGVTDGNVTFASSIIGTGSLAINPNGLTGPETAGGNLLVLGTINLAGGLSVGITNLAQPIAGANTISLAKPANITGDVQLYAENAITLSGTLLSSSTITIAANLDGLGSDGFTANSDIATSSIGFGPSGFTIEIDVNSATGGGTGNASVRGVTTGVGGFVDVNVAPGFTGGGSILDGNGAGVGNVSTGLGGAVRLIATGNVNLDTSTSLLETSTLNGNISVRNTGLALTSVFGFVNNGNFSLSNNNAIDLGTGLVIASGTVTLTTTGANDLTLDGFVIAGGVLTLTAGNQIADGGFGFISAPNINLKAVTGIGVGSPLAVSDLATLSAVTTSGGIGLLSDSSLAIASAIAQTGPISIATTLDPSADLTVTGNIATTGADITLSAGEDLTIASGRVSTDTGNITLAPGRNLTIAARAAIATSMAPGGGAITVNAPLTDTIETIAGTLAANGNITINGAGAGFSTLLTFNGSATTAGTFTITDAASSGTFFLSTNGSITGTSVAIVGSTGASTLLLNGTVASATGITIDTSAGSGSFVDILGRLKSATTTLVSTSTTGVDQLIVTPSAFSSFTFTFGGVGTHTLQINTPLANILAATAGFTAPITFTAATGLLPWTKTAGTVIVTPTVP